MTQDELFFNALHAPTAQAPQPNSETRHHCWKKHHPYIIRSVHSVGMPGIGVSSLNSYCALRACIR